MTFADTLTSGVEEYAQLALDLSPLTTPEYDAGASLADRFAAFHASNPHVAVAIEALTEQWFAAGHKRASMDAVMHRLRWESGLQTHGDVYRLNNSWAAFYSRLMLERHPEWTGRIQTRKACADGDAFMARHEATCEQGES